MENRRKTIDELLAESRERLVRLEPHDALAALDRGACLIDVRSQDERRRDGVVPGSFHVPRGVLEWRLDPECEFRNPALARVDAHVVLMCAEGYSSSLAAATLQELGFSRATDVVGGFAAWKEAGLPVRPAGPADEHDGLPGSGPLAPG